MGLFSRLLVVRTNAPPQHKPAPANFLTQLLLLSCNVTAGTVRFGQKLSMWPWPSGLHLRIDNFTQIWICAISNVKPTLQMLGDAFSGQESIQRLGICKRPQPEPALHLAAVTPQEASPSSPNLDFGGMLR